MKVKRYKNGNITIQRDEPFEKLSLEEQNVAIAILWNVPNMELLGEQGCAGNYDMYQFFYNAYTDKKYMILLGRDQELYKEGKTIRLIALNLDEEDRKILERERA